MAGKRTQTSSITAISFSFFSLNFIGGANEK